MLSTNNTHNIWQRASEQFRLILIWEKQWVGGRNAQVLSRVQSMSSENRTLSTRNKISLISAEIRFCAAGAIIKLKAAPQVCSV